MIYLKLSFLVLLSTFTFFITSGQNLNEYHVRNRDPDTTCGKVLITWECVHAYDSLGNLYLSKVQYDHLPTQEDSLCFEIQCNEAIREMMIYFNKDNAKKSLHLSKKLVLGSTKKVRVHSLKTLPPYPPPIASGNHPTHIRSILCMKHFPKKNLGHFFCSKVS